MKIPSPFQLLACLLPGLAVLAPDRADALVVVVSAGTTSQISSFLSANFSNITEIRQGNYANFAAPATQTALTGADLVIIGRTLASADYDAGESIGYNSFNKPVIALTGYVARETGNRLGWHTLDVAHGPSVAGAETTVTTAGSAIFGTPAGTADFFANNPGDTFNGIGLPAGVYGGGDVLATIGGHILAAHWDAGDAPGNTTIAGVATFPAPRLLFNMDNDAIAPATTTDDFAALTPAGRAALVRSFAAMGLVPVPEPSASFLGALTLGAALLRRKRGS